MMMLPVLFTLLTYNVEWNNPSRDVSIRAIADADADVVVLQEVTGTYERELAKALAKQYPHQLVRLHARGAGGIAVLSKLPLRDDQLLDSPDGWFPALRVLVDTPRGAVQLLGVHLRPAVDHRGWITGFFTTPKLRLAEISAYWPKLARDLPTIVAGDFNEDPNGTAVEFLAERGLERVAAAGPKTWHYVLHGKDQLAMDIDHVMIDGALAASDAHVLDAGTSDHRPVMCTITDRR